VLASLGVPVCKPLHIVEASVMSIGMVMLYETLPPE